MNEQKRMGKGKIISTQEQKRKDTKKVMELVKEKMYDEAIEIIQRYPNDDVLQTKRLEIAIKREEYDILDEMCKKEKFYQSRNFLLKLMTLATRAGAVNGNYEKAKRIAQRSDTKDIAEVQSQMITILLREGKLDEIEEIGNRFLDNKIIQSHMITAAIVQGDYEKVDKIANSQALKNYEPIQKQVQNAREKARFLNEIGNKIASDTITEEDMQSVTKAKRLSKFERVCVLLAACEKKQDVEQAREIYEDFSNRTKIPQELQTLDFIMRRIESGSEKFDFEFYNTRLNWHIHEALENETKEQRNEVIDREQVVEKTNETKGQRNEVIDREQVVEKTNETKGQRNEFINRVKVSEKTLEQKRKKSVVIRRKTNNYEVIKSYLNARMRKLNIDLQSNNEEERQKTTENIAQIQQLLQTIEENKTNEQLLQGLYNKIQQYEARCL